MLPQLAALALAAVLTPVGHPSPTPHPVVELVPGSPSVTVPTTAYCLRHWDNACYTPRQIRRAYDLGPLYGRNEKGQGRTIAIVDSFGSPTIKADLRTFDRAYHLPEPPRFRIITPAGKPPAYSGGSLQSGWATETSLDVEWAHAIAPRATILLVETPSAETEGRTGFPKIVQAETYVLRHRLADVISQSLAASERSFGSARQLRSLRGAYKLAHKIHVSVLGATGDTGATNAVNPAGTKLDLHADVSWPASDPLVTAVGGTLLQLGAKGVRTRPDAVWNEGGDAYAEAGGGGLSAVFARPGFQRLVSPVVGRARGIPDVSLNAAVGSAVPIYLSMPGARPGWQLIGGTSEATPLFAGIVAIADQVAGKRLGDLNPRLYAIGVPAPGLPDITRGDNTVTFRQGGRRHTVRGYTARPGYDLASGLGTVDAAKLVAELARS